jgi:maltooligosyltrehalose trehalohydrolase
MLADAGPADPRHRLAAAMVLLSPFTPLLFMGEEYGEIAPFPYFVDHGDPDLVEAVRQGREREFSGADRSGVVADPADPETFRRAVLDPSLAEREPHRSRLAMTAELVRVRREHPVLTDPRAQQRVSFAGETLVVVRSAGGATASLVFNFSAEAVDRPVSDHGATVVFDSADERWGGAGWTPERIGAHSARLSVNDAS